MPAEMQKDKNEALSFRKETGFFLGLDDVEKVRKEIENLGYARIDYNDRYTQTLYFVQSSGATTDGGYVRARRYVDVPAGEVFSPDSEQMWFLEGKISGGMKERVQISMKEILEIMKLPINSQLLRNEMPTTFNLLKDTTQLIPIVMTQWSRDHYVIPEDTEDNRFTLDMESKYFGFAPGSYTAQIMKSDSSPRLEYKSPSCALPTILNINLVQIPPKWHEGFIRSMYLEWIHANKEKQLLPHIENALSTVHFTKEFPKNWEVEWKGDLQTKDPNGFIWNIKNAINSGLIAPYCEAVVIGDRPVSVQYQRLLFHYYGHRETNRWIRDLVLVQPPDTPILIPQFKNEVQDTIGAGAHNVVLREEKKGGREQAFMMSKLPGYLSSLQKKTTSQIDLMGTIHRERYSFYVSNTLTNRNYSIVADISTVIQSDKKSSLSQVEVEYKGRSGVSHGSIMAQKQILNEFDEIVTGIQKVVGKDILVPTNITKQDWLIDVLGL